MSGYSRDQRRTNQLAHMYGYKSSVMENTVPLGEFETGQGAIVLTKNGEPIMSGRIDDVRLPQYEGEHGALKIGDRWFHANEYSFRRA